MMIEHNGRQFNTDNQFQKDGLEMKIKTELREIDEFIQKHKSDFSFIKALAEYAERKRELKGKLNLCRNGEPPF